MPRNASAALPVAYVVLRILIVLNWVYGAAILALLSFTFVNEPFLLRALHLGSAAENPALVGLWARRRVDDLTSANWLAQLRGDERGTEADAIQDTALEFGIMTEYTSFVAVEVTNCPEGTATGSFPMHGMPVPLPYQT